MLGIPNTVGAHVLCLKEITKGIIQFPLVHLRQFIVIIIPIDKNVRILFINPRLMLG